MNSHEHTNQEKATLGFWIYLMTDLLMFAVLFAVYAVLRDSTFGGISIREIFDGPHVLAETLILLTSSFTCGLAILAMRQNKKNQTMLWFLATFLLGLAFLYLELKEFNHLISEGQTWRKSAFLSSFFALVGTHGLHIAAGLLWMLVAIVQISIQGLNPAVNSKLIRLSLFWHFLDLVWIFIFTIVYLLGIIS